MLQDISDEQTRQDTVMPKANMASVPSSTSSKRSTVSNTLGKLHSDNVFLFNPLNFHCLFFSPGSR